MGIIYLILNTVNFSPYVGLSINTLEKRWSQHKSAAERYKRYLEGDLEAPHNKRGMCSALYRAMNKYGVDKFTIEVIDTADTREELNALEQYYIKEFESLVPTGYNLTTGGDSFEHAEETKELLKVKNKEHMQTTFTNFRKHEEINDLPIHCIYLDGRKHGVAVNKHPLRDHKEFTVKKWGSMESAKAALREYLVNLEAAGIPDNPAPKKKDPTLPTGVNKIKNSYFVDKTINGKPFRRSFSGKADAENKREAIDYLNEIIANN